MGEASPSPTLAHAPRPDGLHGVNAVPTRLRERSVRDEPSRRSHLPLSSSPPVREVLTAFPPAAVEGVLSVNAVPTRLVRRRARGEPSRRPCSLPFSSLSAPEGVNAVSTPAAVEDMPAVKR
ncbi:hypothetical protein Acsp04_62700 [Actinomadura sp. NBRC 104425]|nr:hypothetical protein Acsp04_62700 [Actinomadura sp. NBRC 104425]